MIEKRLEARIAEYEPESATHQEPIIHEILQGTVLASLASWSAEFLRYQLDRLAECIV